MKLIIFLLLSFFSASFSKQNSFLDCILNDYNRHSSFILIRANESIDYIIENDDLYYYFQRQEKLDKNDYKKEIKHKLLNNSFVKISNPNSSFIKVQTVPSVEANAKKGVDEFINIYFNNNTLKSGIKSHVKASIIRQLFRWEIKTKIDDETGYLIISKN
ncbi:hypothetical protein [Chryseobacterium sp. 2R14A]|uniref:hypothetical protein n=1 Tax=Chryseobacterium sp. 2R14A TaxID=3380353 RepID=UPI003CE946D5